MTKKKTKSTGDLIYVEWIDHVTFVNNSWRRIDEIADLEPSIVETVGWVVSETKKKLVVVATRAEHNDATGEFCIIKGCILKRKRLK